MAITSKKRSEVENRIYGFFDIMDKTGKNTKRYKDLFSTMNNAKFEKWVNDFLNDEDEHFSLSVMPYDNEPSMTDIKEACEYVGFERHKFVYYPEKDGSISRTPKAVPVGFMHLKRLQQVLSKKNAMSFDAGSRNAKTNQVAHDSKIARNSDVESYALTTMGADKTLKELLGARADNSRAKADMLRQISVDGFARQRDMGSEVGKKATLNMLDVFLLGAGIKSDLITKGDVLPQTLSKNK